jgi:hypothetical protein
MAGSGLFGIKSNGRTPLQEGINSLARTLTWLVLRYGASLYFGVLAVWLFLLSAQRETLIAMYAEYQNGALWAKAFFEYLRQPEHTMNAFNTLSEYFLPYADSETFAAVLAWVAMGFAAFFACGHVKNKLSFFLILLGPIPFAIYFLAFLYILIPLRILEAIVDMEVFIRRRALARPT